VLSGDADAAIVYVTDVQAAGALAQGVNIPLQHTVAPTYQIAVVKNAKNKEAAADFVESSTTGAVQLVLRAHGFGAPAG
jgi:molybdate transport system substrate-binding protein